MFVVFWRYGPQTEWNVHPKPLATEQDVRAEINSLAKSALETAGRREYRYAPVGEASTWHDPYAEQAARETSVPRICVKCHHSWDNDQLKCACGNTLLG